MSRKLLFIVADDDKIDRKIIIKVLNSLNADIDEVTDCKECLEYICKNNYDCAIIDHVMPDCNGIELIETLRKKEIDIPVIITTGHGDEILVVKMLKAGAYDYIPKDKMSPELMTHSVKGALKWHRSERLRKQAEKEYKNLYETAPIGLWRTSIDDGSIIRINKYCRDVLNIKNQYQIKSVNLYKDKYKRQELINLLTSNKEVENFEAELIIPPDNSKKWVSINAKIYKDYGYIEGCLKDITKEKEMEEELLSLKNKFTNMTNNIICDVEKRMASYVK